MSVNTTVIRNAAWIAAWDGEGHRYLRDGDVAFTGDSHRARRRPLGGTGRPEHRRLASLRDAGSREHPFASAHRTRLQGGPGGPWRPRDVRHRALRAFLRLLPRRGGPPGGDGDGLRGSAALRRHHRGRSLGPVEGWLDCAGRSGLRVYIGPFFADAHWKLENRHELGFDWDETRGAAVLRGSHSHHGSGGTASERPAQRHRLSGPDRDLYRIDATRRGRPRATRVGAHSPPTSRSRGSSSAKSCAGTARRRWNMRQTSTSSAPTPSSDTRFLSMSTRTSGGAAAEISIVSPIPGHRWRTAPPPSPATVRP